MRRRKVRIYRKKRTPVILVLMCVILIGIALAKRMEYTELDQIFQKKEELPHQKTSELMSENTEKYYYQQLSEEQKRVYQEILSGIRNHTEEIYIYGADADESNEVFQKLMKDWPDIFWCDGSATSTTHKGTKQYTVFRPKYFYSAEECVNMQKEIDQKTEEWLGGLNEGTDTGQDDYHKILYVYEKIVNQVEYDESAPDNQNIYSVFVNQRSVCAGYSKATQYLLEKLGIFCTYVTGKTTEGGNHAWNLVKCNGDYYYVDTTWGDPVFLKEEGKEEGAERTESQNISYDYMCCDDAQLFQTHRLDADSKMPACTKMDCNYYMVNGMYYRQYDGEDALRAMNQTITAKESSTVFKFPDQTTYQQAHDDIFQKELKVAAQNLAKAYGLSQVRYQYIDDPRLNKIVIFWQYS